MIEGMRASVVEPAVDARRSRRRPPCAASSGRISPPTAVPTAPTTTAHTPSIEPTEMSMSPARMTWLTPSATIPSTATEARMPAELSRREEAVGEHAKITTSTARNTTAGAAGRAQRRGARRAGVRSARPGARRARRRSRCAVHAGRRPA